MKIVADENIPLVRELFSAYGAVEVLPGRSITADRLADAGALLVRSVTAVNEELLKGSQVQFVGTATIGTDHIDEAWLQQQGIQFASAPGCNAEAVVQYVLSALCVLIPNWQQKKVGIVGCGNVGGRLYQKLRALGVACRCYDPFLDREKNTDLVGFDEVLGCDMICLHTPLTTDGPYPTYHLFDEPVLRKLNPDTFLLNAGRGEVIDNAALLALLNRQPMQVVLDVWEGEPAIDTRLLQKVALGTPHIAGYSYDGKLRGTAMIKKAFTDWLGIAPVETDKLSEPGSAAGMKAIVAGSLPEAILSSYDIRQDDKRLRQALSGAGIDVATEFDKLRKNYPQRLEFSHFSIARPKRDVESSDTVIRGLSSLGFLV